MRENCPKHSNSIDIAESVFCIHEQNSPVFHGQVRVPRILKPMDGDINSRLQSVTKLVILTRVGGFGSCDLQHTLIKNTSPISPTLTRQTSDFSNHNHSARHKCTMGFPGRGLIGQPVNKEFNTNMKFFLFPSNFKSHPCSASKYVRPGPKLPEIFRSTYSTTSSGVVVHLQRRTGGCGCFPVSTDVVVSSITTIFSDASQFCCSNSPVSCLQINLTASRIFCI